MKTNKMLRVQSLKRHRPRTVAVLGGGNGGQTMAAHLALKGARVRLYVRKEATATALRDKGGIELRGCLKGVGEPELITTDIAMAVTGADLIMVVVPADAHRPLAELCAPYLTEGQIVVLHPGRTGGALEFYHKAHCQKKGTIVSEAQTLLYACRAIETGICQVYGVKDAVPVAALPSYQTTHVVEQLNAFFPQFVPGDNVLKTSLENFGAIFHPAITLLNASRMESGDSFQFYKDGVTPSVAEVLEGLDEERVAIATALGLRTLSAREWIYIAYGASGTTLYEAIHNNLAYDNIMAPMTTMQRYITEDVPMSLVPLAHFADMLGVSTPLMKQMIMLASVIHGVDYFKSGRTMEDMGLANFSLRQISRLVIEGGVDDEQETA